MAARSSREYWAARALQRENEAYLEGSRLTAKLLREYRSAATQIRRSINDFYVRYAGKHGLTYEQAVRMLTRREAQEWLGTLGEYVAQISAQTDPKVKAAMTAQLDALSANSQIPRLEALLGQVDLSLGQLYDKGVTQLREEFGDLYQSGYYHKHFDLQSRSGWLNEIAKLDAGAVESAVNYPWSGAMFSDRLWKNKEALLFQVRETLTQGLIQGKGLAETSQSIAARMGQSYKVAERLVRTETNHLHNEADKAAYRAAGVEEYEFMATLDSRTSAVCADLDGKHFPVKDAQPGTNYPPMHPNCRSTTVEYDPKDAADWAASGKRMPEGMTYGAWKQKCVKEAEKIAEQRRADATPLFEAMREKGLTRVPTLDKFSEMRYSNSPAYQKLLARHQNLTGERVWSAVEFNPETVADHFARHGSALGLTDTKEYEAAAIAFVNDLAGKAVIVDPAGIRRVYSEAENLFVAVYPDGTISTFYKPRAGKKYWEGQVKKYGKE